jgi:integration host factor subunit beta
MTKAELIERVSEKVNGLTKRQTEIIVNTVFDSIKDTLAKGEKLEIRGFGSFRIRARRMREGRNPKTGTSVIVPAKRVPFFKAGKEMKEMVDS